MRSWGAALLLFFCLFCAVCGARPASAAGRQMYFTLAGAELAGGEQTRLKLVAGEAGAPAAGFRVSVEYDDTRLRFVRAEASEQIGSRTLRVAKEGNPVCAVYVCDGASDGAVPLRGEIVTFVFEAREGAPEGPAPLNARLDQVCGWDSAVDRGVQEERFAARVLPAASGVARLSALDPSDGTLDPPFSPEIFAYDLDVGAGVREITFRADAAEGGAVRVNRRTLGRAGSETEIRLNVASENGRERAQYTVRVHRAAEDTPAPEDPPPLLLQSLVPSVGELTPAFAPDVTDYMLNVGSEVNSVELTAAAPGLLVSVSRHTLYRAGSSTNILVTVTAPGRAGKRIYTVTVNRAARAPEEPAESARREDGPARLAALSPSAGSLSPPFSPDLTEYELTVGSAVAEVSFDASPEGGGHASVSRKKLNRAGENTEIRITVTSADGSSRLYYYVTVIRLAEEAIPVPEPVLAALIPSEGTLEPPFSPQTAEYRLPVAASVSDVTLRAEPAAGASASVSRHKLNRAGETTEITITVTAPDGKLKRIYTVFVDRAAEEGYTPQGTGKSSSRAQGKSPAGSVAQTGSAVPAGVDDTAPPAGAGAPPVQPAARTLYLAANEMPAFLAGAFTTAGCVLLGMLLQRFRTPGGPKNGT